MKDELISSSDITDWRDDMMRHEAMIATKDDLIDAIREWGTGRAGRWTVVTNNLGQIEGAWWREDKDILAIGAGVSAQALIAACKREVELRNGKKQTIREYVGRVPVRTIYEEDGGDIEEGEATVAVMEFSVPKKDKPADEPDEPYFVACGTDEAKSRAEERLQKTVMGSVWNCLVQIALVDIDALRGMVNFVQDETEAMFERLTQPSEV